MSTPQPTTVPPKVMTIAGSDSGAGAGIQADIKTFSALGVYGTTVITAITAQNTRTVTGVHNIPIELISQQIDAVMEDIGASVAKTGMLSTPEIVNTVAMGIEKHGIEQLVVDPVMIAKSGDRLLQEDAVAAVRQRLLPLAYLVTPNIPEAEVLSGISIYNEEGMIEAAQAIAELGPRVVLVKGGHLAGDPIDIAYDGTTVYRFDSRRVNTQSTHGTGCTYSAAIAAFLAHGYYLQDAIERAKRYLYDALLNAYEIGSGHSPVHHFHNLWPRPEDE